MTLILFGILVLSFFWVRAIPFFVEFFPGERFLITGIIMLVIGLRNNSYWRQEKRTGLAVFLLAMSILAIAWLPDPFRAGFFLLGLAAVVVLVRLPNAIKDWIVPGTWAAGIVLAVQAAFIPLLHVFSARYHRTAEVPFLHDLLQGYPSFPWLATLLYFPLKILIPGTALNGSTLFIPTTLDTYGLTPTWEKLGIIPLTLFIVGAGVVLLVRGDWRRRWLGLMLWTGLYAYIRLLVLFLVAVEVRRADVFWQHDYFFFSFIPLPLLLGAWWHMKDKERVEIRNGHATRNPWPVVKSWAVRFLTRRSDDAAPFTAAGRSRWAVLGAILLVGGLTAHWGFHDPGTPKQGRVLIDEGHSDWEWTTLPFDTISYGGKSGYNYYCLADYWNHYYRVETRRDSLTSDFLAKWDVLIIKTPTSPFSPDEVDAIEGFVREGGGLFLIGDHTNVFGTSTYMNPIAERFGMYFRFDATYKLGTLGLSQFRRPERFPHPVVQFMPTYLFATSCTMYSPLLSENVILGYALRAMYLDYSEVSYFPTKAGKIDYDFGLFVQAGGVKFGKGRVLGYTDSTCFSNFFMFMPGKPELALASIEWLNRQNRWSWLQPVFLLVSLFGLVLLIREARRNSGFGYWTNVIAAGALTLVAVGWITEKAAVRSYAVPAPERPLVHVTFDESHGNYVLPSEYLAINNWQNFQTFFVWTQRLGMVPRNERSVEKALENTKVLVQVHPFRPFSIDALDQIIKFVWRGGTLVVMDSPQNQRSTSDQLLGPFGLAFDGNPADTIAVFNAQGDTVAVAWTADGIEGVVPMLTLADGRTAMGYKAFGEGRVVVCGAAYIFSTENMGTTAVHPNAQRKRLFRAEYDIFEYVAGVKVTGRYYMDDPPGEYDGGDD